METLSSFRTFERLILKLAQYCYRNEANLECYLILEKACLAYKNELEFKNFNIEF